MATETAPEAVVESAPETTEAKVETKDSGATAKDTGQQPIGWRSTVPAEYRDKLGGYESMAAFVADAVDALGARQDTTKRDGDTAAVGVPESPDGYDLPEGAEAFRAKAHEMGLSQDAATTLYSWYAEATSEATKARAAEVEKQLRSEWGAKYDANVASVQRFMQQHADEDFRSYLEETGLGNDPRLVKVVLKMAQGMSTDRLVDGNAKSGARSDAEKLAELYPSHAKKGW